MKLKSLLLAATAGILMLAPMSVGAATLTDPEEIISIETPDDKWVQMSDPNYWFVISNGSDSITIDHLSNGEHLPDVTIATDNYKGVMQSYVSTLNEVFVVKGLAVEKEDLANVMKIISTIQVLRYDTKTAISTTDTAVASDFGLRAINAVYYCTGSEVSVRSSCSVDSSRIGELNINDKITVKGMVTKGGKDYGWYQVDYKGTDAYVNAAYLTPNAPLAKTSGNTTSKTPAKTTPNFNISSKISGSDQAMQVDVIGRLYDENGVDLGIILYQFSDGSFRDDGGNFYYYCRSGIYMRDGILYYISPDGKGESYDASKATMVETIGRLYDENGLSVGSILYQFSDGSFRDDDGNFYNYVGNGVYERNGNFYYLDPNRTRVSSSSVNSDDAVMTETIGRLYDENGLSVGSILYQFSDGSFRDDDGNFYFYVGDGVYERNGNFYYLNPNRTDLSSSSDSSDSDSSDSDISDDAVMTETIGRLYDANGVSVGSILYQFSDGSFRDDDGNFYTYVRNGVYESDGQTYYTSSGVDSETALSSSGSNSDDDTDTAEATVQSTDDSSDNNNDWDWNSGYDDSYDNSDDWNSGYDDSYDNSDDWNSGYDDSYDNSSDDSYFGYDD